MSSDNPKRLLYPHFAALGRALGHEHRLALLEQIGQGEWSVEELAERSALSVANTSQHLQLLRRAGFVSSRKEGRRVFFRLADGPVLNAMLAIQAVAEHNIAEVRAIVADYLEAPGELASLSLAELNERIAEDDILLIDVRDEAEFRQGHLPGAIHVPLERIEASMATLPRDREIVAYCRGRYCVLSHTAVRALREKGFRSRRLAEGFAEWRAAGGSGADMRA